MEHKYLSYNTKIKKVMNKFKRLNISNLIIIYKKINLQKIIILFNSCWLYIETLLYIKTGYYRKIKIKKNKALILIHLGVGDFFNMVPALNYLAEKFQEVHVLVYRKNISDFNKILRKNNIYLKAIEDEDKIENYYEINLSKIKNKYEDFQLIKTGKFNKKFIFLYPTSFYIEIGVNPIIAFKDQIEIDQKTVSLSAINFYKKLQEPYIYTNLVASDYEMICDKISEKEKLILDPFINRNTYSKNNFELCQEYLKLDLSLVDHLFFLINSEECYLIDSSFFNFIAHVNYKGRGNAYMRKNYLHSLDKRLFINYKNIDMINA